MALAQGKGGFVLTPDLIQSVRLGSIIGSSLAFGLCLFVCLASSWVYSVPSARHHLDRVSFRLLLWSMCLELGYNTCFIVLTRNPDLVYNRAACGAGVYFLLALMGVCNWLCTCIGLNLMLAITFGINPIQAGLEKWYIVGSFVLGFGAPFVPAILGHFGPDPLYKVCYFTQGERSMRIRDFVLDLYLWQLLSCLVAAVSVLVVLGTLFRQSRATSRALFRGNNLNMTPSEIRELTGSSDPAATAAGSRRWSVLFRRPSLPTRRNSLHRLEDKLATIALKISLYPLALLLINVIITAEDLSYTHRGGLYSTGQYVVYWLHNFLYGGRGIFFALLGIFVDPCLRLGLPAAIRATRRGRTSPTAAVQDGWHDAQSITDFLSTTGPEVGETDLGSMRAYTLADSMRIKADRESPRWSPFSRREKFAPGMDLEVGPEEVDEKREDHEDGVGKSPAEERVGSPRSGQWSPRHSTELSISFDQAHTPSANLPVRFSPSIPPPSSPAAHSTARPLPLLSPPRQAALAHPTNPNWIQPLAAAVLAPSPLIGPRAPRRMSSDPNLSAAQKRKKELQAAAEILYAQAEKGL